MEEKVLVIVESPTKAKTIKKFLPKNYMVEASVGHVRDLPQSASEIPKQLKGEEWAKLGIDTEHGFKPLYVTPKGKGKLIRDLKKRLKEADRLLLATDEDREGESISWHLIEMLQPKVPYERMVFHEITKRAIQQALEHGRPIDLDLVNAQETRRILDRLYGYTISPLLWKKIAFGLSAGRVQSPGLRLIVDRERERLQYTISTYWDIKADLCRCGESAKHHFDARFSTYQDARIAGSKDFDSTTGVYLGKKGALLLDEERVNLIVEELQAPQTTWRIESVQERQTKTRPSPPFITSTLQQEGNRKLRLSARETMRIAQRLYENGFITYMRTDSPTLSQDGIAAARRAVSDQFSSEFLSPESRQYSSRNSSAQEAHEAIRPAGEVFLRPDETGLSGKELSLYTLIWKRTLASQMADALKAVTNVRIRAGKATFDTSGTRIIFPGFLRVYVEGSDDPDAALDSNETLLPELSEGDELRIDALLPERHETRPPARYTEASLVRELEKMGIGRPSTYAAIINTLFDREYVRRQGTALIPTFIGFGVIQLLERDFSDLIAYEFTTEMEKTLDEIAEGKVDRVSYLEQFYHGSDGLAHKVADREKHIRPDESRTIRLPQITCVDGIRIGKFGPYVLLKGAEGEEELHASIPEDLSPADVQDSDLLKIIEEQKNGPEPRWHDPDTGLPIFLFTGRYGLYYQLGEKSDNNPKPRRASIPTGKDPDEMTLDEVLRLLMLPRDLGVHPETGKPIQANNGRFGPYVSHNGEFRSLRKGDDLYTIGLSRALEILAEPKRGKGSNSIVKELGDGPDGQPISIRTGRYGVYLKHGKKNVGLPDQYKKDPERAATLTLAEAMALITQK